VPGRAHQRPLNFHALSRLRSGDDTIPPVAVLASIAATIAAVSSSVGAGEMEKDEVVMMLFLQRHVSVFATWKFGALCLQHLQTSNELDACFCWVNNIVDVATLCSVIWVGILLGVIVH
jgi:hypothetical protein